MNRRAGSRTRRIGSAAAVLLAATLLAPAAAQADRQATSVEILGYEYEQGSYSLVSGRLATTIECRKNRTVRYLLDQEGDGSFRVADVGLSSRNGSFGLLARLQGDPNLGVIKIVAEPRRVGRKGDKTLCEGASAIGD